MRRYFFIDLPNDNVIHAIEVMAGENNRQIKSLDESVLFIKTTQDLIDAKVNSGVGLKTIFPNGLTTETTYEEAKARVRSSEFKEDF